MIPVKQSRRRCFGAAVASILEIELSDVPKRCSGKDWLDKWRDFLGQWNLSIEWMPANRKAPRGWSILTIKTRKGKRTHAVCCFNGVVMHDPNGKDVELAQKAPRVHYFIFTILDPKENRNGNAKQ